KFHQMMCNLEDLVDGLLERARSGRIVNRMWRIMERDCRKIGKVNLEGYERRQAEIIKQIVDTNARFDYALPRKEKVPPPPEFSGAEGKVQAKEWIEKLGLYFAKTKTIDDEDKITTALYRLSGEAYRFMGPMLEKAGNGEPLGTWAEFRKTILNQYAKKRDKEIAEKEIKEFYGTSGKKKVETNFFTYCSKFRTLGRLSEIDGTTLLREFKEVLPEKVHDHVAILTWVTPAAIPADWDKYVDLCLELHKIKRKQL
ncbi:hypothetical protein WOLCODRAFT_70228, partial [Wolfiporia cocos MD-104 SS10]